MSLFDANEDKQHHLLAKHLPDGRLWDAKYIVSTKLGMLVNALSKEFNRFQLLIKRVWDEFGINTASEMIGEWETSVGIPCSCFETSETLPVRRKQVLNKFNNFGGVQLAEDFARVALDFGFEVNIFPGDSKLSGTSKENKHTIVVELLQLPPSSSLFPLPFPLPFSSGGATNLQCILDMLAPANVLIDIYEQGTI